MGISSLAALAGLTLFRNMAGEPTFLMCSGLVLLLVCVSAVRTEYTRNSLVSPLALYGVLYSVHYGLPAILVGLGVFGFSYAANTHYAGIAVIIALSSFAAYEIGISLARSSLRGLRAAPPVRRLWRRRRSVAAIVSLEVVGWLARFYVISQGAFFQLFYVVSPLGKTAQSV